MPMLLALAAAAAAFSVNGHGYGSLQNAVDAIGDGEGTILIQPGTYRQCAVQQAGRITYRAVRPGSVVFERTTCESKAALVLRGNGSEVDGLIFRDFRVPDHNGAGIRTETGDLYVHDSLFADSEVGITGGTRNRQRVLIDRVTFTGLGVCRPDNCSHSLYLTSGTVTVTRSRFEKGRGGHYIKLRAPRAIITGNSFDDSAGTATSYMIDLPEGATGVISGNRFVQGPAKDNGSTMIAVGAELRTYPSAGLRIAGNEASLAPGQDEHPAFVGDWTGEALSIGPNRLNGPVPFARRLLRDKGAGPAT